MKDMQQSLVFSQPVVAVDDFNSDGKLDLAIVYIDDVGVHIMLGQENGTFVARSSPIPMRGSGAGPLMLGVGDFHQDGHLDLVVNAGSFGFRILPGPL